MEPKSQSNQSSLAQLLAVLRAIHWSHWTAHWQVKGTPSYSDHILFDSLYTGIPAEIDALAEKMVAYFGAEAVAPIPSMALSQQFLATHSSEPNVYRRALKMELQLQRTLKQVYESIEDSNEMSLGLDDFLMAVSNTHETSIYLLRQRLRPSAV
jgi:DNA-binding ferritin-like protein